MWEVWEMPNVNVSDVQHMLANIAQVNALARGQAWPEGFAIFSPDRYGQDPMMSELFLSPVASEMAKNVPASGFTRKGFQQAIPRPYALMVANQSDQDPLVRDAIDHVGHRGIEQFD